MTPQEEAAFEAKAEKMLAGQRELPCGRDYRCFNYRNITAKDRKNFRENFDLAFPDAPGSETWMKKKFKANGRKVQGFHSGNMMG